MTRKTQGWFLRWGRPRSSDAATSPDPGTAPGAAPDGARGAAREAFDLIAVGADNGRVPSPTLNLEALPPAGRAKGRRHPRLRPSARSSQKPSWSVQEGILTLKSFMILYPKLYDAVNVMVNVMADIYDIIVSIP
jgi:hypothetical protein